MKEREIQSEDNYPIFKDKEGNLYELIGDDYHDSPIEVLRKLDILLKEYGIELYIGDCGSADIFIYVKQLNKN